MKKTEFKAVEEKIKALPPKDKPYKHFIGRGLYVYVSPNGSKIWRLKYHKDKKQYNMSLGNIDYVTVEDAWYKMYELREVLAKGKDPKKHKLEEGSLDLLYKAQYMESQILKFYATFERLMMAYKNGLDYELVIHED